MTHIIELPCGIKNTLGEWTKEVELDEIEGSEEDILSDGRISEDGSGEPLLTGSERITKVLSRCTVRIGKDARPTGQDRYNNPDYFKDVWWEAFVADRSLTVIELRRMSLGDNFRFSENCPACKKEIPKITIDLSTIAVRPADFEAIQKQVHRIELSTGEEFRWRMFIGKDEEKILSTAKARQEDTKTALLFLRCLGIGDKTAPLEVQETIRRMRLRDRVKVRQSINEVEGSIEKEHKITCPNPMCRTQFSIRVDPSKPSFFFPSEI